MPPPEPDFPCAHLLDLLDVRQVVYVPGVYDVCQLVVEAGHAAVPLIDLLPSPMIDFEWFNPNPPHVDPWKWWTREQIQDWVQGMLRGFQG